MNQEEINTTIEKGMVQMTNSEKAEHWVNLALLVFPVGLMVYSTKQEEYFLFSALASLAIFAALLWHKCTSPKWTVYKMGITEFQFMQANEAAALLNDWTVLTNSEHCFSALQHKNWQWDGIKVTAVFKDGKLYLNSMVNPSLRSNPFTFGWNQKNKYELIRQYQSVIKGENVSKMARNNIERRETNFWNESEWTFGATAKRIIGYGLSLLLLWVDFWLISEKIIPGILFGVVILVVCGTYIFHDVQILTQKHKRKK